MWQLQHLPGQPLFLIMLFAQVVDDEHTNLCMDCLEGKQKIQYTRRVLEHLTLFNPLKPGTGGGRYELELERYKVRLVFKLLMQLVQAEKERHRYD